MAKPPKKGDQGREPAVSPARMASPAEDGSFRLQLQGELATRSAGERMFDDFLISRLEQGDSFPAALNEANAALPSESLNPGAEDLPDIEAHYRYMMSCGWR